MVNVWTSCQTLLIHDITEDVTTTQNLLLSVFQSQDFFYLAELPTYRITHTCRHTQIQVHYSSPAMYIVGIDNQLMPRE